MIELKLLQLLLPEQFKREVLRDSFGMDEAAIKQRVDHATEVYQVVTHGMEDDRMALLRRLHNISVEETGSGLTATYAWHKVRARLGDRVETATGTHQIDMTDPMGPVNAPKAAETNAKNRVTLSLVGYGFKGLKEILDVTANAPAAEPSRPDAPVVNNAPAEVAADTRSGVAMIVDNIAYDNPAEAFSALNKVAKLAKEDPNVERVQTTPFPQASGGIIPAFPNVTETRVAALHNESNKLNAPTRDPANDSKPAPKSEEADQQNIFGTPEPEPFDPNANASAILGSTKVVEETKSPAPSMTAGIFADQVVSTGPTSESQVDAASLPSVQSLGTGPGQTDVADIPAERPFTTKPTQVQFREFNKRCMSLTRDSMKGIKDGGPALLTFLKKRFGTTQFETVDVMVWEETLIELEALKEPQKLFQHLKSSK